MGTKDIFLFLLFLGLGSAKLQLKNSGQGKSPYALCTDKDTPKEDCTTNGIFSTDHCLPASIQADVAEDIVRVVIDGQTWYGTNEPEARHLRDYVNSILCGKPIEPLLLKNITYDQGWDVLIQMGDLWRLSIWNITNEEVDRSITKKIIVQCIRLVEVSVNVPEGYDINKYDSNNTSALAWAIGFGDLETVQSLVAKGADLNKTFLKSKVTAMHMAAVSCNEEIAKFLIKNGAAVDVVSQREETPLQIACYAGSLKTARVLLNTYSGNINAKGRLGLAAIHFAAMADNPEIVELLISSGADVMAKTNQGLTALHFGAIGDQGRVIEKLVTAGIPVDVPNNDGRTPLMLAVSSGSLRSIEELIKLNANLKATDKLGNTILSYLKKLSQRKRSGVEEILKAHGVQLTVEN